MSFSNFSRRPLTEEKNDTFHIVTGQIMEHGPNKLRFKSPTLKSNIWMLISQKNDGQ